MKKEEKNKMYSKAAHLLVGQKILINNKVKKIVSFIAIESDCILKKGCSHDDKLYPYKESIAKSAIFSTGKDEYIKLSVSALMELYTTGSVIYKKIKYERIIKIPDEIKKIDIRITKINK